MKKRYIILALGTAAVIMVSLFSLALAGDITPSGKPQPVPIILKDAVRIDLLNVDASGFEGEGVGFTPEHAWEHNIPFVFKPKRAVHNITHVWCSFIGVAGNGVTIDTSLNSVYMTSFSFVGSSSRAPYISFQVTDTNVHDALRPNQINVLTVTHTPYIGSNVVILQEFTVYIEYEYQAG